MPYKSQVQLAQERLATLKALLAKELEDKPSELYIADLSISIADLEQWLSRRRDLITPYEMVLNG